jgi:translation initiation factor 5B
MKIRQPIITVCGHVDHGKTSILDKIRCSSIQECEAGGITQKISFTTLTKETIEKRASTILEKFKIPLELPGFLFIDTPGHAAFTNLRKRGGSLADIAVIVIDINDGIKPQTAEVLNILKANKTPFIIALNKIDNISGWKTSESGFVFDNIEKQAINVKQNFDEKFYTIMGALNSYNINSELYFKISDFTKNVAVIPCSAQTGEGISEILAMIAALSQKFLKDRISLGEKAKGVVLEVKKDASGNCLESILYDGELSQKNQIAIASLGGEVITTKIRCIQEALPLNKGYKTKDKTIAASGLKLNLTTKEEILPGMPFQAFNSEEELSLIKESFSEEISEELETDGEGIYIKADSLGSLEALITLLRQKQIPIIKAGIGPITKKDIYSANALPEEDKIIIGFNTKLADDTENIPELKKVKIITNEVVYKLIEDFEEWRMEKQKEVERKKLESLPKIVKLEILDFVFRNSNPAVFGIKVENGKLVQDIGLINSDNEKIGRVKSMQHEKDPVKEAEKNQEIAISMPGVNFERQLTIGEKLFSDLGESQFRKFKENKDILTSEEKSVLQEIAAVKRKHNPTWGI